MTDSAPAQPTSASGIIRGMYDSCSVPELKDDSFTLQYTLSSASNYEPLKEKISAAVHAATTIGKHPGISVESVTSGGKSGLKAVITAPPGLSTSGLGLRGVAVALNGAGYLGDGDALFNAINGHYRAQVHKSSVRFF